MIAPIIDSGTEKEFSLLAASAVTMAHQVAEAKGYPQLRAEAQKMLARWRESEIPALLVADLGYQANRAAGRKDHSAAAELYLKVAKLQQPTTDRPSIRPQHSALLRAARAYRNAGQAEQALKLLRSFEPQEDSPSTVLKGYYNVEVGKTLAALGRKNEALEKYVAGAKKGRGLVDNSNVAQLIEKLGGVPLDPDRDIDVVYLDNKAGKPFHCRSVATDGHQIFVAGDYRLPWRTNGVSAYHPARRTWKNLGGPTSRVSCLTYDDEYLWVGTDEQGLWRCDLATTTWKQWEDLPDKRVVDILIHDGDAYVSVGSANSGGMLRIKAEKLVSGDSVHVYQAAGAPTGTLRHLTTDGKKIYGVNQSLYELDLKTDQWHSPISQATGRPIHSAFVYCGVSGLWGSHSGKELFQIGATSEKNQRFSKAWFPSGQGKAGYSVAFAAEHNGQIWFAGFPWERFKSSGLYRLDLETGEFKMFSPRDGFRTGGLYRCYDGVWLDDSLWLATSDGLAKVTLCNPSEHVSKTPVEKFAETIKTFVPKGWTVSVAGKSITLRRKEKVLWVPLYGRPAGNADETDDEYLHRIGAQVTLEIDLRFRPRMTDAEYKELTGLHSAVLQQGKNGFHGKSGLSRYFRLLEKVKLPIYFTADHTIFVDGVPPQYTMHDDAAHQEMQTIFAKLNTLLELYEGAKPLPYSQEPSKEKHSTKSRRPLVEALDAKDRLDEKGFSQLHRAASSGNVEFAQSLIDRGANVDIPQRTFHGTPLQYAASAGQVKMVELLLKHKATVDATDMRSRTPLMWAASQGHPEVVTVLINAGADINSMTRGRWTALHYAAEKSHLEVARLLVENGASLAIKNSQGKTPLNLNPEIASHE